FFFFQAEDGIRDSSVTGVQTCALPIYPCRPNQQRLTPVRMRLAQRRLQVSRSEERRVGKECRSRWSAYHYKKNSTAGWRRGSRHRSSCLCGKQLQSCTWF